MGNVFEGKTDGRQSDNEKEPVSRFRPRYRALTDDEKALHDRLFEKITLDAMARALKAHSPTPPRVDEKEMKALLWECRNKAKGWETNRTALTENGEKYLREDVALAFGRALMEKCK